MALDLEFVPRLVLDTNVLLSFENKCTWNSLGTVNATVEKLQSQLLVVQSDFSVLNNLFSYTQPGSSTWRQWFEKYWADCYLDLLRHAAQLNVDRRQIEQAEFLAATGLNRPIVF